MVGIPLGYILVYLLAASQGQDTSRQIKQLKNVVSALSRQVMLQQLATEEKIRADGGSGIKQIRVTQDGPETYYSNSHSGNSMAAIHDHANNKNMLGQGEGEFVLNGVEFRTRHNDYILRRPSTKSNTYNLLEDIPYPPVPKAVLDKLTVQDQVNEMREWFKAWKNQDYSVRDYRSHFRAVLCYMEGAWTTKTEKVEEPFFSDRHALDADTWFDLQEKVRFTGYTGRKSLEENYAYLPTTIINITEAGLPIYAQWNYRILCHPFSQDLPTSYLKIVNDLTSRLPRGKTLWQHGQSRAARFRVLGPKDRRITRWTFLDSMMSEVPGKDNYVANITDDAFGMTFFDPQAKNNSVLNVGYYHRFYRVSKPDAMGLAYGKRGFSDPNVFVAETTQPRIAPMSIRQCKKGTCYESLKRISYAIPLEIIYLTPLSQWNPYKLEARPGKNGKNIVTQNGKRKGRFTKDSAYNGTHWSYYYRTPTEFFSGGEVGVDPADTVKGSVGVLDADQNVKRVSASGVRIFLPKIPGVGVLRTRYPIMPVHGESSGVWKELNALKDVVMKMQSNSKYLIEKMPTQPHTQTETPKTGNPATPKGKGSNSKPQVKPQAQAAEETNSIVTLVMSTATEMPPGEHSHTIELTTEEITRLQKGNAVESISSEDNGHSHSVTIKFYDNRYHVTSCDDGNVPCWDGHTSCLMTETEDTCPPETGNGTKTNVESAPEMLNVSSTDSIQSEFFRLFPLPPTSSDSSPLFGSPANTANPSPIGELPPTFNPSTAQLDRIYNPTFINPYAQVTNNRAVLGRLFGRPFRR